MELEWITFTRRTNDPKLSWLEKQLDKRGIEHKREGMTIHAPILKINGAKERLAWDLLTRIVYQCPECLGWDTQKAGFHWDGTTNHDVYQCNHCKVQGEALLFIAQGRNQTLDDVPDDDRTFLPPAVSHIVWDTDVDGWEPEDLDDEVEWLDEEDDDEWDEY